MLYDIFKEKRCFKLICGAGNEDTNEVEKLTYLYSLAGCSFFDVCAKKEVVLAAKKGIDRAGIKKDRYICISVGAESDQHFCKAQINENKCAKCGLCDNICPQKAIENALINQTRCIGCSKCIKECPNKAIKLITHKTDLKKLLPPLVKLGLDCIEFHILGDEGREISVRLKEIMDNFEGPLSLSINRERAGDKKLIKVAKSILNKRKPYTTIIQADGIPMSGGKDSFKSTLQAISTADLFLGANLPCYIMVSGGTNSKTSELAKLCGVEIQGVAIGSYARKIVQEYTKRDDFFENKEVLNNALKIAKNLVDTTTKYLN